MRRTRESHPAVAGCLDAADRCVRMTQILSIEQYNQRLPGHDSIGNHMRHCLDYFTCLLRGMESGLIDYDARDRDDNLASDPERFRIQLAETMQSLKRNAKNQLNRRLKLRQTVASDGRCWTVETTVERELAFCSGHCVHHLAIASLLANLAGVEVDPNLGVAYSTEVFRSGKRGS